jgi:hypothetical protein
VTYEIELGPRVVALICDCCGQRVHRVWGSVAKDGIAHSVYFSLLTKHDGIATVGHTVSLGSWWNEAATDKFWLYLQSRPSDDTFASRIGEPEEANQYPWIMGGTALSRKQALEHPFRDEFFAVTDFVNTHDPAVHSYLQGMEIDSALRAEVDHTKE